MEREGSPSHQPRTKGKPDNEEVQEHQKIEFKEQVMIRKAFKGFVRYIGKNKGVNNLVKGSIYECTAKFFDQDKSLTFISVVYLSGEERLHPIKEVEIIPSIMKVKCIKGINIDLTIGKIYEVLEIEKREDTTYYRIVDDCGEDYIYESSCFETVEA